MGRLAILALLGVLLSGIVVLQGACARSTPLQRACDAGRDHLRDQRWERAEREYDRALRLRPGYGPAHAGRAAARVGLTRYDGALSDLDAAVSAEPGRLSWRSRRGVLLLAMGRPEEAVAELDRVLAKAPDHAASLAGRAVALLRLGRCPEARRDFLRARKLGVPIPDEWMSRCPGAK
jgi:tetratricopeptide (TPR) repeat protein